MCGRFAFTVPLATFGQFFPDFTVCADWDPRYNIAPTQVVPTVINDGNNEVRLMRWGLIPHWAKDESIGNRMINARCETLAEKPAFRDSFKKRRCVIFVDGFYEWRKDPGGRTKTPIHIKLKTGEPFAFAGLWTEWRPKDGNEPVCSCTIITCHSNELIEQFHHRMPVILPREALEAWLDPEPVDPEKLKPLLKPFPSDKMFAYPVATVVNNPRNDLRECTTQAGPEITQPELRL